MESAASLTRWPLPQLRSQPGVGGDSSRRGPRRPAHVCASSRPPTALTGCSATTSPFYTTAHAPEAPIELAVLARATARLDRLGGDRVELGLGAGTPNLTCREDRLRTERTQSS